jgi:hypothetical protein
LNNLHHSIEGSCHRQCNAGGETTTHRNTICITPRRQGATPFLDI